MKTRLGSLIGLLFLLAPSSEAGLFKRGAAKYTPPKAISMLTQGADETHKLTRAAAAPKPEKYGRPEWGNVWKQTLHLRPAPTTGHYNEF